MATRHQQTGQSKSPSAATVPRESAPTARNKALLAAAVLLELVWLVILGSLALLS